MPEKKEASSEAFLFLLREGYFNYGVQINAATAGSIATAGAAFLARLVKDQVMGDSLDIPFVKWMRVHDFKHEISYQKKDMAGNLYINAHNVNPDQGQVKFKCLPGKQTPQLSFGCMAQEKFPLAIFCFRRQTGVGYEVRAPHLVVGLKDCLIRDWHLSGNAVEEAALWYNQISWFATSQLADTNLPNPLPPASLGVYDVVGAQGGSISKFSTFVAGFAAVITAAAAAAVIASDAIGGYKDG
ncbi:MAG: type VI secretion system tube protein Hcp [Pirellulaceae bacterium]